MLRDVDLTWLARKAGKCNGHALKSLTYHSTTFITVVHVHGVHRIAMHAVHAIHVVHVILVHVSRARGTYNR